MDTVILAIHLMIAVSLVGIVLLQRSEGGALGIGGGGGGGLVSRRSLGNALTRTTAVLAACFFVTSVGLTLLSRHETSRSILDDVSGSAEDVFTPAPAAIPEPAPPAFEPISIPLNLGGEGGQQTIPIDLGGGQSDGDGGISIDLGGESSGEAPATVPVPQPPSTPPTQ